MDRLPITRRDIRVARWLVLGPLGFVLALILLGGIVGPPPAPVSAVVTTDDAAD